MRPLKYHESKLLKKVNFGLYKTDNFSEINAIRNYRISKREDYLSYVKLANQIRKLANRLSKLDPKDPYRIQKTEHLLTKLYNMGLIKTQNSLAECEKVSPEAFCRRRLPVVLIRMKFSQNLREAVTLVEQGQIRIGPEVVTDPAYLVTRNMEDFITWTDGKIKRTIMKFNDNLDDFELLNG